MAALFPPFTFTQVMERERGGERSGGRGEVVLCVFKWQAKTGTERTEWCKQTSTGDELWEESPYLTPSTVTPFHIDTHSHTHTGLSSSSIEEQEWRTTLLRQWLFVAKWRPAFFGFLGSWVPASPPATECHFIKNKMEPLWKEPSTEPAQVSLS